MMVNELNQVSTNLYMQAEHARMKKKFENSEDEIQRLKQASQLMVNADRVRSMYSMIGRM
jgi:hypothetical protein